MNCRKGFLRFGLASIVVAALGFLFLYIYTPGDSEKRLEAQKIWHEHASICRSVIGGIFLSDNPACTCPAITDAEPPPATPDWYSWKFCKYLSEGYYRDWQGIAFLVLLPFSTFLIWGISWVACEGLVDKIFKRCSERSKFVVVAVFTVIPTILIILFAGAMRGKVHW